MNSKDIISFDYAIKYLLRDKSDYYIVEGFISALLSSCGYKPVKIVSLLESESNKEGRYLKRSVADLIVEDESGNNYIVEIDRAPADLFLHKALFNTSRLIVDNIGTKQEYNNIKKVFHINLLYSPTSEVKAPLYHGSVIFHDVDKEHPTDIHLIDRKARVFDACNILPEYIVVSIPLFNDIINKEIDEWLYVLKHSSIKEDFKSPYMKKVEERLNILKMTPKELREYDEYLSKAHKELDITNTAERIGMEKGLERGLEIGLEKGKIEEKIEIARKMLFDGLPIETIQKYSGLTLEEVERLKTTKS